MKKKLYDAPMAEVIEMELQGMIAASGDVDPLPGYPSGGEGITTAGLIMETRRDRNGIGHGRRCTRYGAAVGSRYAGIGSEKGTKHHRFGRSVLEVEVHAELYIEVKRITVVERCTGLEVCIALGSGRVTKHV